MKPILADLLKLLTLENLDRDLFRGQSQDIGTSRVFGGQVLGQALAAATATVDDVPPDGAGQNGGPPGSPAVVHSLHAYFLRAGDHNAPIVYQVDRQRDGRSFISRRVVAIQHGQPILNLAASFHRDEKGLEHQDPMPQVPGPESLKELDQIRAEFIAAHPGVKLPRWITVERPFEMRPVESPPFIEARPASRAPDANLWFRAACPLPDDPALHRTLLAYFSDYTLIGVSMNPHLGQVPLKRILLTSLDHAIWFHRDFRMDEWMLYTIHSPSAIGGRGLSQGRIYRADGALVAVVAQEGVLRVDSRP